MPQDLASQDTVPQDLASKDRVPRTTVPRLAQSGSTGSEPTRLVPRHHRSSTHSRQLVDGIAVVSDSIDDLVGTWHLAERHGFDRYLAARGVGSFRRAQLSRSAVNVQIARSGATFRVWTRVHAPLSKPADVDQRFVANGRTVTEEETPGGAVRWLAHMRGATLVLEADTPLGPALVRRWVEAGRLFHETTDARRGVMMTQVFARDLGGAGDQRPMSLRSWVTRLRTE